MIFDDDNSPPQKNDEPGAVPAGDASDGHRADELDEELDNDIDNESDDESDNESDNETELETGDRPALVDETAFDDEGEDDDLPLHFHTVAHGPDGEEAGDRPPPEPEGPPEIPLELIDQDAIWVVRRLHAKGYEAYLTGGCVRDLLLGRTPKDFDVATAAHPNQVRSVFRNCRLIGRRFRLAHVFFPSGKVIETATFRANPIDELEDLPQDLLVERDNVFGNVEQDARRRDLTVNGLFYDPLKGKVLDYVDGRADLEARLIRTIGEPEVRFREDPVRILRAIKFATRLGFTIEEKTFAAMKAHAGELVRCAPARLQEEVLRLLTSGHATEAMRLCDEVGVLRAIVPELSQALQAELEAMPASARAMPPSNATADETPPSQMPTTALGSDETAGDETASDDTAGDGADGDAADGDGAPSDGEALAADAAAGQVSSATVASLAPAPVAVLPTPPERQARFAALLASLDAARARDADLTSAVVFAVLLTPAWEAFRASTTPWESWVDETLQKWTERIRLTRHDKERVVMLLNGQDDLLPARRRGQQARSVTHRPSFKETLLVYTLRLHAAGQPLDEVGLWKVIAQAAGAGYRQARLSERGPRQRAAARADGGGGGGGGGRGRGRDRGRRRRR